MEIVRPSGQGIRGATISAKVFEPDAHKYYGQHFGTDAEFAFSTDIDSDHYATKMHKWPSQSPADAIAYRGDVVGWTGTSGRWACWGERRVNLCVLQFDSELRLKQELFIQPDDYVPLVTLYDALSIAGLEITSRKDYEQFAETMRSTFDYGAT